jgi:two-component system, OmpR family, sensor kinase
MSSLFARIWLSYWLMMALTLGAALAVSYGLAIKRAEMADRLSPVTFARTAQGELSRGGRNALGMWVMAERHTNPELEFYFVDDSGREFLGRDLAGQSLPGPAGAIIPRISAPGAPSFRLYMRRTSKFSFGAWQLMFQPWLLIALAIGVTGLGSAALARHLARPLARLRSDVRTVAAGEIQTEMSPWITRRRDEVGGLGRDIDQMTAHLRSLIKSKEDLLRDISHELRSPLARLRIATTLVREESGESKLAALQRIDREVERLDDLIGQILQFSRVHDGVRPEFENVDLTRIAEETAEDARVEADRERKTIRLEAGPSIAVRGDPSLITSAVENVLRNAVRFAPAGTPIDVALTVIGSTARVRIADRGPGIDPLSLPRICEPFYRAQSSSGVGLGLAIAERIATLHGGRLLVRNRRSGGLAVELFFPTGADEAPLADFGAPESEAAE